MDLPILTLAASPETTTFPTMSRTLEQRVESLEKEMQAVKAASAKGWLDTFGAFADDPLFESAMEAGESWRKEQTWEKERGDAGS